MERSKEMITRTSALLFAAFILLSAAVAAQDPPQYSAWSTPENLTVVNSTAGEAGAFISRDGLSLYFGSTRGANNMEIWVSHRPGKDMPWEAPQKLGPDINTSCHEQTPTLSIYGHWLYFARDCGGFGGQDIYVSRRHNKREDSGWQLPVNLGSGVNTDANESCPALFEDEESGVTTLYFSSGVNLYALEDIYASTLQEDGTFGQRVLVEELSLPDYRDARPFIWKNGLIMLLDSNRPGTLGGQDLFISVRASTSDPWSTPESLGDIFNSSATVDARPVLSFDGTELYFHSNRKGTLGGNDIYRSTRTKLKGPDKDEKQY
jgi:hypothetical protein